MSRYLYQFKNIRKECEAWGKILSNPNFNSAKVRIFCNTELYKNYLSYTLTLNNVSHSFYQPLSKVDLHKLAWIEILQKGITPQRLLNISGIDKLKLLSYTKNEIDDEIERELEYVNSVIQETTFLDKKTPDEIKKIFAPFSFLDVESLEFDGLYNSKEFLSLFKKMLYQNKTQSFDVDSKVHIFDYTNFNDTNLQYTNNILLGLVDDEYFKKVDVNRFIVLDNASYSYYLEVNNVVIDMNKIIESLNLTLIPEKKISEFTFTPEQERTFDISNLDIKSLIGGKMSVSKIKQYDGCHLKFWLELMDKTKFPVINTAALMGSACHYLINKVLTKILDNEITKYISDGDLELLVRELSNDEKYKEFLLDQQNSETAIIKSVETLKLSLAQLRESKFELYATEKKLGENLMLVIKNQILGDISITGTIDRIDYLKSGDIIYFNVIDYKSGDTKFQPNSLQLELYASSLLNLPQHVEISGLLLHKISTPMNDLDKNYESKNQMQGINLLDTLSDMAPELDSTGKATYINASKTKQGSFSKYSQVATSDEINSLLNEGISTANNVITEISKKDSTPFYTADCIKCPYAFICEQG